MLGVDARSLFAAPLRLEGRPTGLLLCYAEDERTLGNENLELLGTIANHTSIALEEGRRRDAAAQRTRMRELFESLRAGERRQLDQPHAVVVVEAQPTEDTGRGFARLGSELAGAFPGTLVDARGHALRALVPVGSEGWCNRLATALAEALEGVDCGAGISEPTDREWALAFRQAEIAAAIGGAGGARRVRSYADLGAQRHLWTIAREGDPDPLEAAVTRLSEVDARRGSQLFRTLEVYLEQQGNARQAAAVLYIHRNTLRQRLRRRLRTGGCGRARPDDLVRPGPGGAAGALPRQRRPAAGRLRLTPQAHRRLHGGGMGSDPVRGSGTVRARTRRREGQRSAEPSCAAAPVRQWTHTCTDRPVASCRTR